MAKAQVTSIAVGKEVRHSLWEIQVKLMAELGHPVTVSETIQWLCDRELTRETT